MISNECGFDSDFVYQKYFFFFFRLTEGIERLGTRNLEKKEKHSLRNTLNKPHSRIYLTIVCYTDASNKSVLTEDKNQWAMSFLRVDPATKHKNTPLQ